ncbi:hypothetical protein A3F29_01010 [Candidatus Roizmanbacteria bacterium RIFCSPHIGHO2_12_FULL_33_9]|uniref:LTD domain-containing protein n=1 Tax=Candidatus Roizmanbacteria bacterium RIFCSPHIGHO2_12_FULL_33_9 TaxID=1802045 RepID=A0A1F7HJ96_9BACT|nr:MAG: hypothetical protein A3F29_01010 [Candidatus Roizmanbacteria bacterium RIFCSPHIGHO2_12_FULL_33_9]
MKDTFKDIFTSLTLIFIVCIILPPVLFADIKLNEVLVEPDQSVELLNTSTDEVDLSSWYIDDSGGTTYYTIPQNTIIHPGSCLVFSSNFNFNKASADTVRIFDNTAPPVSTLSALIDTFSYSKSPGDGISFIRSPDAHGEWTTASASLSFFNTIEETCLYFQPITPSPTPTPSPAPTVQNNNNSTNTKNIYISEAMVAPDTGNNEWVELYNDNAFDVNLIDWYIDDIAEGGSTQKKFSLLIPAYGYMTVDIKSAVFNNSGDEVRLLNPLGDLIDSFKYDFSEKGKSFGRESFNNSEFCLQESSKNKANNRCIEELDEESKQINDTDETISLESKPYISEVTKINTPTIDGKNYIEFNSTKTNDVLGASTLSYNHSQTDRKPILNSLLLISTSYSLLTLLSVSLKIKLRNEKNNSVSIHTLPRKLT